MVLVNKDDDNNFRKRFLTIPHYSRLVENWLISVRDEKLICSQKFFCKS